MSLAWCFLDERNPHTENVRDLLRQTHAVVPPLWRWELCNGLIVAKRRLRISLTEAQAALTAFDSLPIRIDPDWGSVDQIALFLLADHHQLTAYDAAYLELAHRSKLPLATLDHPLAKAATSIGIKVL